MLGEREKRRGWEGGSEKGLMLVPQLSRHILVDPSMVKIAEGLTGCFGAFYREEGGGDWGGGV